MLSSLICRSFEHLEIFIQKQLYLIFYTSEQQMSNDDKGYLTASFFAAMFIGGYIWGSIADKYGRVGVLFWTRILNSILILASSFAPNFKTLLILRSLIGLGTGGGEGILLAYFTEFQPKDRRGSMISSVGIVWVVGPIIAAALAWLILPMPPLGFFNGNKHIYHVKISHLI